MQTGDVDGVQNTIDTVPNLTLRNNIALRLAQANRFAEIERLIEATLQQREEQSKANKESRSTASIWAIALKISYITDILVKLL